MLTSFTPIMDCPRKDFLARSSFSSNEYRNVWVRYCSRKGLGMAKSLARAYQDGLTWIIQCIHINATLNRDYLRTV
jgi:hypothetical protein